VPELQRLLLESKQILRANHLPVASFTMQPDGTPEAPVRGGQAVRFQDTSTDDAGVVAREWDFDGNGSVDSTKVAPSFTFRLNKTYRVTLRVRDADGDWSEPASREITVTDGLPSYPDIIVDNDAAQLVQFVGRWPTSSVLEGFYGRNYAHDDSQGKGQKLARYTVPLPTPGSYDVGLSYTATTNRADNVPVVIRHRGGETRVIVNQRRRPEGVTFVPLGTFAFEQEAVIEIRTEDTTDVVVADAVRLIYAGPSQAPDAAPADAAQ
jgi:PKD repeat protein